MNLESWANLLTIVGSVLLSAEIFKSGLEEKDESRSWWDAYPFQTSARKAIGVFGLLLLIVGFAMQLNLSLAPGTVEARASVWFIASIVLGSSIMIAVLYAFAGPLYVRRRRRHFAHLALGLIGQYRAGTVNPVQLYNGLLGHVSDLPEAFGEGFSTLYSEMNLFQNIVPDGTPVPPSDRSRCMDAIVIRKGDAFEPRLESLELLLKRVC